MWNNRDDKICYLTNPIKNYNKLMKRIILSEIAKIFDSLSLLDPIILYAKRLIQDMAMCFTLGQIDFVKYTCRMIDLQNSGSR